MRVTFRPMPVWPHPATRNRRGRYTFRSTWGDTLAKIEYEIGRLHGSNIVIGAGFEERDIRNDGMPRSSARMPSHPGIEMSFDTRHGRLIYATDVCEYWEHNVRSIALGLEALRAVDRFGISRRGEQYAGWKALPPGIEVGPIMSLEEAAKFILDACGDVDKITPDKLLDGVLAGYSDGLWSAYRTAAKRLHPDAGGEEGEFQKLHYARQIIEGAMPRG